MFKGTYTQKDIIALCHLLTNVGHAGARGERQGSKLRTTPNVRQPATSRRSFAILFSFFIFMASNSHIFFPSYSITLILIMLLWELYVNTAAFVIRETTGRYGAAVLDTIETRVGHWGRMTGGCGWLARLVLRVLSVVGRTISKGSK